MCDSGQEVDNLLAVGHIDKGVARIGTGLLKNDLFIILLIVLFAFGVRYVSLMDQGITWDEPVYLNSGIVYVYNVIHLDFSHSSWNTSMEHPTFGKLLYGMAVVLLHHGLYDYQSMFISKILSAVMGALTCALAYLIGREFIGRHVGAAAAIILALIPVFVAHNQQAALDTPLALIFTVTMFLFMLAVKRGDWRIYAISAVSLGILVDTKFTGLLIVPVMALFYLIHRFMQRSSGTKQDILLVLAGAIGFTAVAGLTLYALWPWVWNSPSNLVMSVEHSNFAPQEYFLGTLQRATPIY
jgi:4-amino-4-deoxy-L-arabinose transferase-like glycosyltransferase